MRKKICFCLALVILLSSLSMLVGAVDFSTLVESTSELGVVEPKSFSTATLENDFADDRVLVVLNNKASLKFKSYSVSDFAEVKCAAVRDLSTGKKKQVETKMADFQDSVRTMSAESKAAAVEEINKYNQIICLELADKGKENVLEAIKALQSRDDVKYAGPDYPMTLFSTTSSDTHYANQWAISAIDLDDAWSITSGSSNVFVGILDTGIDASHPDLQGRIVRAFCADFVGPYLQTVPTDSDGHGTHVAGIIAANKGNGQGIAGAASGVKIGAFKVAPPDDPDLYPSNQPGYRQALFVSYVIEALDYAEDTVGFQILNLSAGVYSQNGVNPLAMEDAIENYSGLIVCAAGNEYTDIDITPVYPACFSSDKILVVGASTPSNQKWGPSNKGATSVDVFAPGVDIMSCFPTAKCQAGTCGEEGSHANGYHCKSGTSMATPYVTAIAALMLSKNPSLTPLQIKNKIIATCTDYDVLRGLCVSGGIVNAYQAVLSA